MASRLSTHMNENNLAGPIQSTYMPGHSTETALLYVHNNILRAVDEQKAVALVLLDLSAAFDTIDHNIILSRLSKRLGVGGVVLHHILKEENSRLFLMKHCHGLVMYCMFSHKARYLVQIYLQFIHCLLLTSPVNTNWRIIYMQMIL